MPAEVGLTLDALKSQASQAMTELQIVRDRLGATMTTGSYLSYLLIQHREIPSGQVNEMLKALAEAEHGMRLASARFETMRLQVEKIAKEAK